MPASDPSAPRRAALALIRAVLDARRPLADILQRPPAAFAALPPEGRARAQRLALDSFRHAGRADHHLRRALRKTPPEPVHWVMRLALIEIHVAGSAPHGVIHDAVTLVAEAGFPRLKGLCNAVLRQLAEDCDWQGAPVPRLPGWLRGALQNAYGAQGTAAIEAAHLRPAPLDLTLNGPVPEGLEGERLPTGSLRVQAGHQVSRLPGYAEGRWWVQDAAAALPARLLSDMGGARVLDLCAAPGGKTMQLAAMGARVTALDLSEGRLARLRENLARTGLAAEIVCADALDWHAPAPFDAILLDAPCTATGTIRRHPELPWLRGRDELRSLRDLQAALLDRVLDPGAGLLCPGGRVVYCTCSLLPAEGEDQIAAAARRHAFRILPAALEGVPQDWISAEGFLRTRPDYWTERGGLDGFFVAALQQGG